MDLGEFEVKLVYKVSSRAAKTVTWRNPVSGRRVFYIHTIFYIHTMHFQPSILNFYLQL